MFITYVRAIFLSTFALYFFIAPAGILIHDLRDPGLHNGQVPLFTYRWHKQLSSGFASWASNRVKSEKASKLDAQDISGTEWPMFSAVYYLWATESLQSNWESNQAVSPVMPKIYAKKAIEASAQLISDPDNAAWVIEHWGEDYLHQENVFYRMLLIAGLTSYQKLTGDEQYRSMLLDQVNTLSKELDDSQFGLLDDYPGQCYPVDILPAIAVISRADEVLGSDHSQFVTRSLRAFKDTRLDKKTNLPAYIANAKTGHGSGSARGVGISYMLIWAPELWPKLAREWYKQYDKYFWHEGTLISGFRELPKGSDADAYFFDVDAGPVIAGYGVAASAFGIGAARVNNQADQAYALGAEALVSSWPLPNGTLMISKLLSNFSDAPYLGETALLFAMTREKILEGNHRKEIGLPYFVYIIMFFYLAFGLTCLVKSIRMLFIFHANHKERQNAI
ncbi:MAG: hypothetical protein ACI93R_001380 [Flavobacteriales bacterium]|jgi:hypothetical protein